MIPIHALELRILIVVSEGPTHGYRIVKEVEALEGGRFKLYPANLYRRIRDLLARGLIEATEAPSSEESSENRRNYFRITHLGREVVKAEIMRLEELVTDARASMQSA